MRVRHLLCFVPLAVLAACQTYTTIPDGDRERLQTSLAGQDLWLQQSAYAGALYDDDRYRLIHPRRFEELTFLRTPDGQNILPPPSDDIIPAGTRVRVERIEWPTGDVVFRRPLYTPRYNAWIMLRVARERGNTTLERKQTHVLLIPNAIRDAQALSTWLHTILSTENPNEWLQSLPELQRNGVLQKTPVPGMDRRAITAALGTPDQLSRRLVTTLNGNQTIEMADYGSLRVILEDGVVARFEDSARASRKAIPARGTASTSASKSDSIESGRTGPLPVVNNGPDTISESQTPAAPSSH